MTAHEAEPGSRPFPVAHGVALALAVFLSHVPFLLPGFGTDSDAWKFASAIREIATTGRYTASRSPGYPLMELTTAPFHALGPLVPNALSALAAAACAWLVARLAARQGMRDAWLAGAAFAFLPAAYIAGTSSMDFLWALAFALAAWLDAAQGRAARAGLWLGLAAATRLTSVLFAPSLALLLMRSAAGRPLPGLLRFAAVAGLLTVVAYVPMFLRYGWVMFSYSEITGGQTSAWRLLSFMPRTGTGQVPWPLIAGQATVLLWGALGCLAVAASLLSLPWQRRSEPRPGRLERRDLAPMALVVGLEALLFLRLPHDEGYLLPTVPFVLLALASILSVARFRAVCAALLLSPFLLSVDVEPPKKGATPRTGSPGAWRMAVSGETVVVEPLRGPVLRDHAKRVEQQRLAEVVRAWWPTRPERFQVIAGSSYAMLYHLFPPPPYHRRFVRSLTPGERASARADGVELFALPDGLQRIRLSEGTEWIEGVTVLGGPEGIR